MNAHNPPLKIDRAYALARLNSMCETLAAAKGDDRERILRAHSRVVGSYAERGLVDGTAAFNSLLAAAKENGHLRETSERYVGCIIGSEMRAGALNPPPPVQAPVAPPVATAPAPSAVDPSPSPPAAQNANEAGSPPASLSLASVNLEAALGLAHAGNAVFPCGADKRPTFVASWRASSTTNENILREAFERHSAAVPAIDCGKSNLFVIDADRKPGAPDGVAHFEGLCAANNGLLPGVPRVNTPGGGVHYIFSQPPGEALGNSPGALGGRGIDARGVGGYILAPGATLPDGRRYAYAEGSARLDDGPPPPPPQWLLDVIRAGKPPATIKHKSSAPRGNGASGMRAQPDELPISSAPPVSPEQIERMENIARRSLEKIANAPPRTSNDTINREAHTLAGLVAAGLPAEGLREHALAVAMERAAKGGNDPHETCKTFDSGWASGRANPLAPDAGMPAEAVEAARASVAPHFERLNAERASHEAAKERTTSPPVETIRVEAPQAPSALVPAYTKGLVALSGTELLKHDFPPREMVLSPWLPEKGLAMIFAERGIGKTWVGLNIAHATAGGGSFLRWRAPCPKRVVYIDGEMPAAMIKDRYAAIVAGADFDAPEDNFRLVAADLQQDGSARPRRSWRATVLRRRDRRRRPYHRRQSFDGVSGAPGE